jgi:hypothetical protein
MSSETLREALERAQYLLRTVAQFIHDNPIGDYSVRYDDANCDASCLKDDCSIAADELERCEALAATPAPSTPPSDTPIEPCGWLSYTRGGLGWCACGRCGSEKNMVPYAAWEAHNQPPKIAAPGTPPITNLSQEDYNNIVRDAMYWRHEQITLDKAAEDESELPAKTYEAYSAVKKLWLCAEDEKEQEILATVLLHLRRIKSSTDAAPTTTGETPGDAKEFGAVQHGGERAGEIASNRKNTGHGLSSQKTVEGSTPRPLHQTGETPLSETLDKIGELQTFLFDMHCDATDAKDPQLHTYAEAIEQRLTEIIAALRRERSGERK